MTYPTEPLPLRRQRDQMDRERLAAASLAKKQAKHKGRNHWRNWERRQMLLAKKRAGEQKAKANRTKASLYVEAVRAYWRGERQTHPA